MPRTRWLRLAMPAILSTLLALPGRVEQAHSHAVLWVMLLLAMATACLIRPFRSERLLARPLVLLLILPAATTDAMVPAVPRGDLTAALAASLCVYVTARMLLAVWALPPGQRRLSTALDSLSPESATLARAELALLWFGMFRWRPSAADRPARAMAFPATEAGIELAICWLTLSGFVIETPLFHVLAAHVWNARAAWACTGLHLLLGVYLVGYAKSLSFRPTLLFQDRIEIRSVQWLAGSSRFPRSTG